MAKNIIDVKILGDASSLSRTLATSESQVGVWSANVAKLGVAAVAGVVAAGAAAAVGLFKLGQSFDKEFDKIRVGTGATGDALAGLEDSFETVLKSVPTSFGDAGTAIADLNQRLGLSGKPLEDLSGQFINLSRITETDLSSNIDNITRVFGDWSIATGDQAESLDAIYRAAQSSGIGIDDLSSSVVQFGAPLRNLGFGFDESLALLAQFNKTGVNTETVFAGLKAGVGKLAKAGEDVPATFRRVVDEITALGPGTEATALAIDLFGQRAGPDLADAIAGGKFSIDEMLASITDGGDTINGAAKDTEDFSEKWSLFKNWILVGLQPLAEKVFEGVGKAMDNIGPKVEPIIGWFSEHIPDAVEAIKDAWEKFGQPAFDAIVDAVGEVVDFFEEAWPKVTAAVAGAFSWIKDNKDVVIGALIGLGVAVMTILVPAFIAWAGAAATAAAATLVAAAPFVAVGVALAAIGAAAVWAYQNVGWFRDAVDAVVVFFRDTVWPILQATYDVVVAVVTAIVDWIVTNWDTIKTVTMTVFDFIRDHFQIVWDAIYGIVEGVINAVRGIIEVVTSLIKGDWEGVWNGIKLFLEGIWTTIKAVVEGAIGYVKNVIGIAIDAVKVVWETVWQAIANFVSDRWDDITTFVSDGVSDVIGFVTGLPGDIVSAVDGAFDAIWDQFKGVLNSIINAWNDLGFTLPEVSIDWNGPFPGGDVSVGGWTISTPNLPTFHSGGMVPGPRGSEMLAVLQGGERVMSIDEVEAADRPIVLVIEGRPFTAMLAEHDRAQVGALMAGVR